MHSPVLRLAAVVQSEAFEHPAALLPSTCKQSFSAACERSSKEYFRVHSVMGGLGIQTSLRIGAKPLSALRALTEPLLFH